MLAIVITVLLLVFGAALLITAACMLSSRMSHAQEAEQELACPDSREEAKTQ